LQIIQEREPPYRQCILIDETFSGCYAKALGLGLVYSASWLAILAFTAEVGR
jgi:hypothetical protein